MNTVPSSHLPQLPSLPFGELSNFLRSALADEDSRILSESLQQLALQADSVAAGLRVDRRRDVAAPHLMDMLTALREHRAQVLALSGSWRGLYEYGAYLQALNNFRVLIGQWLLDVDPWDGELRVSPEEFSLVSWRTLGEGTLLIDMHEQWLERIEDPGASDFGDPTQPQRARQWWKLRR